jgi:hypothetical protein
MEVPIAAPVTCGETWSGRVACSARAVDHEGTAGIGYADDAINLERQFQLERQL